MSSEILFTRIALDGSVAIVFSVVSATFFPKPDANTVTPLSLTSVAASKTVSNGVLPSAANSLLCSPSEISSTTLVAPKRASAKSSPAASKPPEIEVLPFAFIWSIATSISDASYDHPTRVVAIDAKDTTEKRAFSGPREYWLTSLLAKAFSPLGPSIEPSGLGFFIEPLSSSSRAKSIDVAQDGLDGGGGWLGLGGGGGGGLGSGESGLGGGGGLGSGELGLGGGGGLGSGEPGLGGGGGLGFGGGRLGLGDGGGGEGSGGLGEGGGGLGEGGGGLGEGGGGEGDGGSGGVEGDGGGGEGDGGGGEGDGGGGEGDIHPLHSRTFWSCW